MSALPKPLLGLLCTAGLFGSLAAIQPEEPTSALVTLLAHDDLSSSFSFRDGACGGRVTGGQIDLGRAQLSYGVFAEGLLSYGFARDELVGVVDLGDTLVPPAVRAQDATLEHPISIFQTLQLDGAHFTYLTAYGKPRRAKEADALLGPLPAGELVSFEPLLGHVYVIRYRSRLDDSYDRVAKFQVVDLRPGESLTLRWASLATL